LYKRRLGHNHKIGEKTLRLGDLLPYPVAWGEASIGVGKLGIDGEIPKAAELVRPHVLHSQPDTHCVHRARDVRQGLVQMRIVINTVVDHTYQSFVIINHPEASPRPPFPTQFTS
jgi:hypothetical protein